MFCKDGGDYSVVTCRSRVVACFSGVAMCGALSLRYDMDIHWSFS